MAYQLLIVVAAKNGSSVAVTPTGSFTTLAIAEAVKAALTKSLETALELPAGEIGPEWGYRIECMRKT